MALNDTDLERIAAALSGQHGTFPVSNLVNYGSTIVVRPGARTLHGVVFSGAEIASMLPDDYTAFPLAVEYAAEPAPDFDSDLLGLEADARSATRARQKRLRTRYARVTERFRYRVANFRAKRKVASLKRAEKALLRLQNIWEKMGSLRVSREGLIPPARLAAELRGLKVAPPIRPVPARPAPAVETRYLATRPTAPAVKVTPAYAPAAVAPTVTQAASTSAAVAPVAPVAPVPATVAPTSTYTPVARQKQAVSEAYYKDQAALEKELSEGAPSYYGASDHATAQEALAADLRAETVGYLFGAVEHDYYGIDAGDDVEFTSMDFRALLGRDAGDRIAAFAAYGLEDVCAADMIDLIDGVVESERLSGLADQFSFSRPVLANRLRKKALAKFNAAGLAKLGAEDADDEGEAEDAEDAEQMESESSAESVDKPVTKEQAKAANLQRRVLLPSASELRAVTEGKDALEKAQRAAKVITQITDALRTVSPSGSVNYARLVPASGFGATEPILVIGIQKKTGVPDSLLDLLYEEEVARVPPSYDVPDAVRAITTYTSVGDYLGEEVDTGMNDVEMALYGPVLYGSDEDLLGTLVRGSASTLLATMNEAEDAVYGPVLYGGTNAYPNGTEAPLPPPRRLGVEVYGA
jgi:hypothetical protein